jgi:hypothetical protein
VFAEKRSLEVTMKSLIQAVAVAVVLAAPVVSFAQQSNGPVTRAQVRAELAQLEKAGYRPSQNDPHYPDDIQAAETRVTAQNGGSSSYGGVVSGSSASGAKRSVSAADWRSMYGNP